MKYLFLCTVLILSFLKAAAQSEPLPNIIIIYMDDMGYGDIEPFGMTGIPTPNFNKLAAEGMRYTNFNVAQAVCTASRAALLTGCYPNRIGMTGALLPESKTALHPKEETIASLLKAKGYKTSILGKWHLGNNPPYFPLNYGFDSFYGIPYSHDIWPMDYHNKPIKDSSNARKNWPELPIYEGDQQVGVVKSIEDQEKWTSSLTHRAVNFISDNKKNPFFLYLAHPMPHVPLASSSSRHGKSELGKFGEVIAELDWSVGKIIKTLDSLSLSKNTLLIVTSDNGPWSHFGDHAGSSGGLREGKSTPFEGGTRVPLLMKWPGKLKPGYVSGELMTNMDILPTLCAITGAPLPNKKIDGVNLLPFLTYQVDKSPRELFYYYFGNKLMAVRYKQWKLILPHNSQSYSKGKKGKDGVPGNSIPQDHSIALYNLTHDPAEEYDVRELYPEIEKHLLQYASEAREDLGDEITGKKGKNVREPAIAK